MRDSFKVHIIVWFETSIEILGEWGPTGEHLKKYSHKWDMDLSAFGASNIRWGTSM